MDLSPREPVLVAALYRFARVDEPAQLRDRLAAICREKGLRGTLILAREGINGTVAGSEAGISALTAFLQDEAGLDGLELKFSRAARMPFHRMKVRVKREIVTMGVPVDPPAEAGSYVEPAEWNALLADPDTIAIDTRNDYETALGTFSGAVDPGTSSFREFPAWAERNRDRLEGKKIAMFCTGGIRCEKATAYLRSLGLADVFHLKGGILKYLEEVPAEASRWQGECFVFDERVAVGHGLEAGCSVLCRACRRPLTSAEQASPLYAEGVSCPHCHGERSDADRQRYAERQRQVELAARRGAVHIGG